MQSIACKSQLCQRWQLLLVPLVTNMLPRKAHYILCRLICIARILVWGALLFKKVSTFFIRRFQTPKLLLVVPIRHVADCWSVGGT
jgi:hypothetical protein